MATVTQVCEVLSEVSGIPYKTIRYFARRLGQADLLPRGPRGRNAPNFDMANVSILLLATMAATDGTFGVGAQITTIVKRVGDLSTDVDLPRITPQGYDHDHPLVRSGSFDSAVTTLLQDFEKHGLRGIFFDEIGVTYSHEKIFGWIRWSSWNRDKVFHHWFTEDGNRPSPEPLDGFRRVVIAEQQDLAVIVKKLREFSQ